MHCRAYRHRPMYSLRCDKPVEAPFLSDHAVVEESIGTGRDTGLCVRLIPDIHGVVAAHGALSLAPLESRAERGPEVLDQLAVCHHGVEFVSLGAIPILEIVGREMLRGCNHPDVVFLIKAL